MSNLELARSFVMAKSAGASDSTSVFLSGLNLQGENDR